MELALKHLPGRVLLNSVNLEDGLEKFDRVASLAKAHGAALVALTIDEKGMAKTREEKVRVALRMYERLTEHHGFRPEDLLFDLLTFPITQGDEESRPLARETLLAMEELKERLPGVGFILGISNVSFGLKPRARRVLNSVFLDEARKRGLTAAIVDAGKILPIAQIPEEAYALALDLIHDRRREGYDPLFAFMAYFEAHREDVGAKEDAFSALPLLERLKRRVVEGRKGGLEADLEEALKAGHRPLDLINGPLLEGMKEVGELFGAGKMQLPFVLQAAEVMKRAVAFLEPHMEKRGEGKGKMVLATVKGDVHDIGKNLVDIILTNNGYQVINLGIKVPIEEMLKAVEEHRPHALGMSGLLVKSTVVMKENLEYMAERGYTLPVILGGAALTRAYVEELKAIYPNVHYAEDAFEGLRLMEELTGHAPPELTRREVKGREASLPRVEVKAKPVGEPAFIPRPPFFGVRKEEGVGPPHHRPLRQQAGPLPGPVGLQPKGAFPGGLAGPGGKGGGARIPEAPQGGQGKRGGLSPGSSTASSPWPGKRRSFWCSAQRRGRFWSASPFPGRRAGCYPWWTTSAPASPRLWGTRRPGCPRPPSGQGPGTFWGCSSSPWGRSLPSRPRPFLKAGPTRTTSSSTASAWR
jgi:5-methyltetrahydrofolate--homocysteine methyltransferase